VSQTSGAAVGHNLERWLRPTRFIDGDDAEVAAYARRAVGAATEPREKAVKLYYAVRDDFRYDPYRVEMSEAHFRASACIERGYGFCITKAVLLAAALRAAGVPARLGFGDVRNHLATKRLIELNNGDVFYFHGYTDVLVDGRWVKATPAFNIELCEKFGVLPLEFDGRADSVFHPFDKSGRRHMEYVQDRGTYDDLPFDEIRRTFLAKCPAVVNARGGDFAGEAERERGVG
jgi:transglutaminase-like putative cysteine protease